jgi:nitroimidazol reductase NimA-like FMN-containing flavoprotein (pyridoxamine 5'-phosphate oxidase superfamily)
MTTRPEFLVLTSEECRNVLERNRVGRLAFVNGSSVDIEPIGYVSSGDWIFFRSAYGAKLEALSHNPFAAFEVDHVAGPTDWVSVVVHGTIYMLPPDGGPIEKREFARAVAALRKVMPTAFTDDDPTPYRENVYGLHIDRLSGRMAQPAGAERKARTPQPIRAKPKRRGMSSGF